MQFEAGYTQVAISAGVESSLILGARCATVTLMQKSPCYQGRWWFSRKRLAI
jgi:hypothetical protein